MQHHLFADRGWYPVACYAHVSSHFASGDLRQDEGLSLHRFLCNFKNKCSSFTVSNRTDFSPGYLRLVLAPPFASLAGIPPRSSRRQVISGFGYPRALHVSLAEPPSGTIRSPEVSSEMMSGGITTSRNALCNRKSFLQRPLSRTSICQPYLALHRVRIDLTHVQPAIRPLGIFYVQRPRVVVTVCYRKTRVICNNVLVNRQNCFCVGFDPRHLLKTRAKARHYSHPSGGKHFGKINQKK